MNQLSGALGVVIIVAAFLIYLAALVGAIRRRSWGWVIAMLLVPLTALFWIAAVPGRAQKPQNRRA